MDPTANDPQCTVCLSPGNRRVETLYAVDGDLMCEECRDELADLQLI